MKKREGIFTPIEIIQNIELDWENKILLSEIISLSKLPKGCYASNQFFADFLQIKKSSLHRRIQFLVDKGYITTQNQYSGKKCVGRIIKPTGKVMVAENESVVAHATNKVAHATIKGSTRDHTMVAGSDPIITFIKTDKTSHITVNRTEQITEDEWITNFLNKK